MNYKLLGKRTGLPVSEFALGAGNFGQAWGYGTDSIEADRIVSSNPCALAHPLTFAMLITGGYASRVTNLGQLPKKRHSTRLIRNRGSILYRKC